MKFRATELMVGTHQIENTGKVYPLEFKITWGADNIKDFLNPKSPKFGKTFAEGYFTAGGLCYKEPCIGTLELNYFKDSSICYSLGFTVGGSSYIFQGRKINIKPWNIFTSHATCFGTIVNTKQELISTCDVFFKWHTLPSLLASIRVKL